MTVQSRHPDYERHKPDWDMLRTFSQGEREVKEKGTLYLPIPSGFAAQGLFVRTTEGPINWAVAGGRDATSLDTGLGLYATYINRAQFPDILSPTLTGMVGLIHRVDAQISGLEDKKPLSALWDVASIDGLTLEAFHRRITTEILLTGRFSVLVDVPSSGGMPYFAGYTAERLINWSEVEKDLFVFDETRIERNIENEFVWTRREHYRVLRLIDGVYTAQVYNASEGGEIITPTTMGTAKPFNEIPLVVVGPRDIAVEPGEPPLYGVARACLAIYRLDADYRHQLYMTGQETLFITGMTDDMPSAVGAGIVIGLPTGASAAYVGPKGVGIEAHRVAIQDERSNSINAGLRLFDPQSKVRESGEALRLKAASQTTTLTTIAQASASALEKALRYAAMFIGQDPNEIIVKPNLKFVDTVMLPADALALTQVWQGGAISKETLYDALQRGEIASEERTFEEEQALINKEQIDNPAPVPAPKPLPNDPNAIKQQSEKQNASN